MSAATRFRLTVATVAAALVLGVALVGVLGAALGAGPEPQPEPAPTDEPWLGELFPDGGDGP